VTAFRAGDVFVRHGSSSERWNQSDVQAIYARVVERERERWLREAVPELRRAFSAVLPDGGAAALPMDAGALVVQDAETFEQTIRKHRTETAVSSAARAELRDILVAAEEVVREEWARNVTAQAGGEPGDQAEDSGEISRATASAAALDRIAQVGAALIDYEQTDLLRLVIETLVRLFQDAPRQGPELGGRRIPSAMVAVRWRDVLVRVYVLGALSVYREQYSSIKELVLQKERPEHRGRFWLRETVTSLARSEQFQPNSLIPLVTEYVADHPVFFRRFRSHKDDVVNALCRFDFLQCAVSVAETNDLWDCFPNFGAYYNERTEPVVQSLVTGGKARDAVPTVDDAKLAEVIRELDKLAGQQFVMYAGWDSNSWNSQQIKEFLTRNTP
jgi:hypothetical protein